MICPQCSSKDVKLTPYQPSHSKIINLITRLVLLPQKKLMMGKYLLQCKSCGFKTIIYIN
jgi:DNA-directed RNA polymerase subunit RPC12/RpoP